MTAASIQQQAAALRAACTDEERATFRAVIEHEVALDMVRARAHAPDGALDHDVVRQTALTRLRQCAHGLVVDDATGETTYDLHQVPTTPPTRTQPPGWYRFTPAAAHRTARTSTTDAVPDAARGDDVVAPAGPTLMGTRIAWALIVGCVCLLAYVLWPRGAEVPVQAAAADAPVPATATTAIMTATVSLREERARNAKPTDPTTLEIGGGDGGTAAATVWRIRASAGELGGVWRPDVATGQAAWLADSVVNPIICVPAADAALLRHLKRGAPITLRLASATERAYTVLRVDEVPRQQTEVMTQRALRLTVIACGAPSDRRVVVTALLKPAIDGLPPAPDVTAATIPNWLHLDQPQLAVEQHGDTLTITVTAAVQNLGTVPLAADEVQHQLTVDGTALPAALVGRQPAVAPNGTQVWTERYRAPAAMRGRQAVWTVVTPDGQRADVLITIEGGR